METDRRGGCKLAQICSGVDHSHCTGVLLKHSCLQERMVALGALPPRKKSADLGSSRCEVDIKRVIRRRNPARKPVKRRPDTTDMPFVSLILRPPRKKSADLGSSRCEVDIKRVYDAVIRPGNLSNAYEYENR